MWSLVIVGIFLETNVYINVANFIQLGYVQINHFIKL